VPSKKPPPDFVIRFTGSHVRPWLVPLRALTKALDASQKLLVGDDDNEINLQLLEVKSGSAAYKISTDKPDQFLPSLQLTGDSISHPENAEWDDEGLTAIKDLSAIAKSLNCTIEFRLPGERRIFGDVLATITHATYDTIASTAYFTSHTSVVALIERVGGATKMGCAIRVTSQPHLVYCSIANEDLVRELGKQIYKQVSVSGKAKWLKRSQLLKTIEIDSFQPLENRISSFFDKAKVLGSKWGDIRADRVDDELRELRQL